MKAMAHSAIAAANVVAYLSGSAKLKEYKGSIEIIVVTNGKGGGRAYMGFLWGITLGKSENRDEFAFSDILAVGAWFARMIKSKTLLVPMTRGSMGYKS